jgi:benzodiazapine receptor
MTTTTDTLIVVDTTTTTDGGNAAAAAAATAVTVNTSLNKYNWLNLFAYAVNVFVTFGIGMFGLTGQPDNSDLSAKYQTIVTPFGLSFSIWGIIFIWQAFWILWQFLPSQRNSEGVIRAWYYYPIMTFFQALWTISFSYEIIWLSLICMYSIVITLVMASMSLQKYKKSWKGYLLWQGPISIQTGWIMAAAVVNTNVFTVACNASTTVQLVVSSLSLVVLLTTAFTWLSSYPVDFAIPLVIVWALGGVYAELQQPSTMITDEFTTEQIMGVQYGVLGGLCLVSFSIIVKALYAILKQRPEAAMENKQEQEKGAESVESASSSEEEEESQEEAV